MRDTSPEIEELYRALLLARSGAERLEMGCDMFTAAREIAVAGLKRENEARIPERLFLRFYGREFAPAEQTLIRKRISERAKSSAGSPIPGMR